MEKGFTLIELLVVVLIVGVLAAVALPQYTNSVEKARAAQGLVLTRAIAQAQNRYYLANASYTKDLNDLDIEIPGEDLAAVGHALSIKGNEYFDCSAASGGTGEDIIAFCRRKGNLYYIVVYTYTKDIYCGWDGPDDASGKKWCQMLTGRADHPSLF